MDALQQSFKYAFEASKFIKNGPELKGLNTMLEIFEQTFIQNQERPAASN